MHRALIQENSRYAPDAWLAHAEYYFDQGKLQEAIGAYEKVAGLATGHTGLFARYKLGWVYFNLKEWEQSLKYFRQVTKATADRDPRPALYEEALKGIQKVYSVIGPM